MQNHVVCSYTNDLLMLFNLQLNHVTFKSNKPGQPTKQNIDKGATNAEKPLLPVKRVFRPGYDWFDNGRKQNAPAAYTTDLADLNTLFRGSAGSKRIEYYFTSPRNSSSQLNEITAKDLQKENLRKAFLETLRNIGEDNLINCHN